MSVAYMIGDCRALLAEMPAGSVDLIVTSWPYLEQRDYLAPDDPMKALEIGHEGTPAEYIKTLLGITAEFRRVLAPHGSIATELGDKFSDSGGAGGDYGPNGLRAGQQKFRKAGGEGWPLERSLAMIPELYRVALAYGVHPLTGEPSPAGRWRVRNVVVHGRPNPPVGALGDKYRPACSYWVVACVNRRWFDLDAVRTEHKPHGGAQRSNGAKFKAAHASEGVGFRPEVDTQNPAGAPPLDWFEDEYDQFERDLWTIPTFGYKGAHYACVDDQTEALTPFGWKRQDELCDGDVIAAYDAETDQIGWEPTSFARYRVVDEEMVLIDKRHTSQMLTTNHRVLLKTRKRAPHVRRADEVTAQCDLMLSAPWRSKPVGSGPGEKMAELVGWFLAEGWIPKHGHQPALGQSLTANPEKVDRIRQLLNAVGADYREKISNAGWRGRPISQVTFVIRDSTIARMLIATEKRLSPEMVFDWSDTDARALLDGLVMGDGSTRIDGRMSFIQKSRATADLFQALALRCGFTARLSTRKDGVHTVSLALGRWVTMRGTNGVHEDIPRTRYSGIVWCPQVRTTFWLARRDGKPFVTGNTFAPELVRRFIVSMCPARVCRECGKPSKRITGRSERYAAARAAIGRFSQRDEMNGVSGSRSAQLGKMTCAENVTVGWTDCGHGAWRPGITLDPFGGSGTTGMVAAGNGRDALLFDLDGRNLDLARERIGMFLDEPA